MPIKLNEDAEALGEFLMVVKNNISSIDKSFEHRGSLGPADRLNVMGVLKQSGLLNAPPRPPAVFVPPAARAEQPAPPPLPVPINLPTQPIVYADGITADEAADKNWAPLPIERIIADSPVPIPIRTVPPPLPPLPPAPPVVPEAQKKIEEDISKLSTSIDMINKNMTMQMDIMAKMAAMLTEKPKKAKKAKKVKKDEPQ